MTCDRRVARGLLGALSLCFCVLLFLYPKEAAAGVRESLLLCARSLVPSLFVFAALSQMLVESGVFFALGGVGRVFGLSAGGTAVFLTGLLSGFPMGAAAAEALLEKGEITREEARAIVPLSNRAGMAFVVGAVGEGMMGSRRDGVILYALQMTVSVLFLALGTPKRRKRGFAECPCGGRPAPRPVSEIIVLSVSRAGAAMISVCSYVLFFGAVADFLLLITRPFLPPVLRPFLCGMLEIGRGCSEFARLGAAFPTLSRFGIGFSVGFSGLSVTFQIADRARSCGVRLKEILWRTLLFAVTLAAAFTLAY